MAAVLLLDASSPRPWNTNLCVDTAFWRPPAFVVARCNVEKKDDVRCSVEEVDRFKPEPNEAAALLERASGGKPCMLPSASKLLCLRSWARGAGAPLEPLLQACGAKTENRESECTAGNHMTSVWLTMPSSYPNPPLPQK